VVTGAMVDTVQKRLALIEHLRIAIAIASELGDQPTESLIVRALDQARADEVPGMSTNTR